MIFPARVRSAIPLFVLFILLVAGAWHVTAQTEENPWVAPLNLSNSGAATSPVFITDGFGGYHVFWQDPFAGYGYAVNYGEGWSPSSILQLPFSDPPFTSPGDDDFDKLFSPVLVTDANYLMHAFWLDDDDLLWYSRAVVSEVGLGATGWTAPVQLATAVKGVDVSAGASGRLHLTYIHVRTTAEQAAGVYYQYSDDGGANWATATAVYTSEYLRSVNTQTANLDIATAPDEYTGVITTTNEAGEVTSSESTVTIDRVHIAWDDPDIDAVFTARSLDGGPTWESPLAVDFRLPEDPAEVPGPRAIQLFLLNEQVHLSWNTSHEEDKCNQYHQVSADKGQTWGAAQIAYTDRTCPVSNQLIYSLTDVLFLLTTIREEAYLQAWDGSQWTSPVLQMPTASFVDPTTYRLVNFDCLQTAVTPANNLLVVGCGKSNGDDVWTTERPLGSIADWSSLFAPVPAWSSLQQVAVSPVNILLPELVAGTDGRLHVFWGQTNTEVASGRVDNPGYEVGNAIYYSRLDSGTWSSPRPVLTSPEGKAENPSVIASQGRLFVAWSGGQSGGLYFSRALADRAASVTEWVEPQQLPSANSAGTAPDMVIDRAGVLYVAYTIPLNENRGIYLTKSSDNGSTWSDPVQVFDGIANNWQMVGVPRLAITDVNTLHLLWTRQTTPSGTGTLELVYASSGDGGESWTAPRSVVQEAVLWSDIMGVGELTVHRVWISLNEERPLLWHQISTDKGISWSNPARISDPNTTGGATSLIQDAAGEPHLFQLAESNTGDLLLQEWLWDGLRWEAGESADLGDVATNASAISAVAAPDSTLGVLYTTLFFDETAEKLQDSVYYVYRLWDAPDVLPTPPPTLTPTPPPAPTETPIPEPSPTPTVSLAALAEQGIAPGPLRADSPIGGILFGLIPATLLLLIVSAIAIRIIRAK